MVRTKRPEPIGKPNKSGTRLPLARRKKSKKAPSHPAKGTPKPAMKVTPIAPPDNVTKGTPTFNFWNLTYHQADYGFPAEWHFFATSHGKGPCDALGATFKRTADSLTNFDQVTDITAKNFTAMVVFVPEEAISRVKSQCEGRQTGMVEHAPPIFMMLRSHFFQPTIQAIGELRVSRHSCDCPNCVTTSVGINCPEFLSQVRVCSLAVRGAAVAPIASLPVVNPTTIPISNPTTVLEEPTVFQYQVNDFVAAVYGNDWFLGQVASIEKNGEYFVQFLKRLGMNQYRYCTENEQRSEQCIVSKSRVLGKVQPPDPVSNYRNIMKLSQKDHEKVVDQFAAAADCVFQMNI